MCRCHVTEWSDDSNLFSNCKICHSTDDCIGTKAVELGNLQLTRQYLIAAVQLIKALGSGWVVETTVLQ
jgi:hypothetical protein